MVVVANGASANRATAAVSTAGSGTQVPDWAKALFLQQNALLASVLWTRGQSMNKPLSRSGRVLELWTGRCLSPGRPRENGSRANSPLIWNRLSRNWFKFQLMPSWTSFQRHSGQRPVLVLPCDCSHIEALVDTAAWIHSSTRSFDSVRSQDTQVHRPVQHILGANNLPFEICGTAEVKIEVNGITAPHEVYVCENLNQKILIGVDFLNGLTCNRLCKGIRREQSALICKRNPVLTPSDCGRFDGDSLTLHGWWIFTIDQGSAVLWSVGAGSALWGAMKMEATARERLTLVRVLNPLETQTASLSGKFGGRFMSSA